MAVYPRGKYDRWYYKFVVNGVTYKKSIPEAQTKKQAEHVENLARLAVYEGRYGKQEGTENFTNFVDEVYLPWAKQYKRSYYHDERYAVVICDFFRGKAFRDISPMLIEKFKKHRREQITQRGELRNMSTVNRELAQLSKMFSLAFDYGYCESNPCRRVKAFKVDNRRERFITHGEESQLFEALTGRYAKLRSVATIALYTGMRRGEILRLEWCDVDLSKNEIHIPKGTTKSGKGRTILLHKIVRETLLEMQGALEKSGRLFAGSGYHGSTISETFSRVCRELGFDDVTLHTLRHTFATRLKDAGVDPFTIRDLMGHAHLRMTDYYTHATPETMRRGIEMLETPDCPKFVPTESRQTAGTNPKPLD